MATFEQIGLASQIHANVYGLVRDMRDNAGTYKALVTAGRDVGQIAVLMVADANEYLRRIQWMVNAFVRNQTLCTNALQALGLTLTEANSLKTTLQGVANHTKAATLTTGGQINTEADYILANVPSFERLY